MDPLPGRFDMRIKITSHTNGFIQPFILGGEYETARGTIEWPKAGHESRREAPSGEGSGEGCHLSRHGVRGVTPRRF